MNIFSVVCYCLEMLIVSHCTLICLCGLYYSQNCLLNLYFQCIYSKYFGKTTSEITLASIKRNIIYGCLLCCNISRQILISSTSDCKIELSSKVYFSLNFLTELEYIFKDKFHFIYVSVIWKNS